MKNNHHLAISTIKIVAFAVIGLCVVGQLYLPIPIIAQLPIELGNAINPSHLISGFGYSYAAGFLFFGPLSDRYGKKNIMLAGMACLLILTLLIARTQNHLLTIRILQGFFAASYPPLVLAYIGQYFPNKYKGIAVSAMAFAFLSAVIISQLFVVYIAHASFISAQNILSMIYITAILALWFFIHSEKTHSSANLFSIFIKIPKVLLHRQLVVFYIITFFVLLIFVAFYLIIANQMTLSKTQLFNIRLIGLPAMLLTFAMPKITQLIGSARKTICIAFLLQLIGLTVAGLGLDAQSMIGFLLASFILTTATAILVPTLINSISNTAQNNEKGTAIALYTFILFCGASFAPLFVELLAIPLIHLNIFYLQISISIILLLLAIFGLKGNQNRGK